jgi:hypothetical protein
MTIISVPTKHPLAEKADWQVAYDTLTEDTINKQAEFQTSYTPLVETIQELLQQNEKSAARRRKRSRAKRNALTCMPSHSPLPLPRLSKESQSSPLPLLRRSKESRFSHLTMKRESFPSGIQKV